MKKILSVFLIVILLLPTFVLYTQAEEVPFDLSCASAVLMEARTGKILYEKNAEKALPPASVTKVMTLLLVMEAVASGKVSWDDTVSVSEHAASMGGSQIYLKVGETMPLSDMVKSVVIASANDAAVALAEHVSGSEEAFVAKMNARAAELSMTSTHFENTNGLDDTVQNHVTSARDIAIMSRELIKHPRILEYSSTWMDTIRDGAFTLANTNRLVRFYPGATGLKTGSTAKAKFCISATAERNGVSLIAVIMGAETRDVRNAEAKKLLDYGFAGYGVYRDDARTLPTLPVDGGMKDTVSLSLTPFSVALPKEKLAAVEAVVELPMRLCAPLAIGDKVGRVVYTLDGETIGETPITVSERVDKISFLEILRRLLGAFSFS
ncbi:MAG: D-alanyl-D-alanine carboxypeptidase [Ruminococcaceae bacterium]|nr:D-alanyl-D-alanine carboxypeptidase [Oscillospiraceae bacterium]